MTNRARCCLVLLCIGTRNGKTLDLCGAWRVGYHMSPWCNRHLTLYISKFLLLSVWKTILEIYSTAKTKHTLKYNQNHYHDLAISAHSGIMSSFRLILQLYRDYYWNIEDIGTRSSASSVVCTLHWTDTTFLCVFVLGSLPLCTFLLFVYNLLLKVSHICLQCVHSKHSHMNEYIWINFRQKCKTYIPVLRAELISQIYS